MNIKELKEKISPLPWRIKREDYLTFHLCDDDGFHIVHDLAHQGDIDERFIVHAANNFFELVEALEAIAFYHGPGTLPDELFDKMNDALKKAQEVKND